MKEEFKYPIKYTIYKKIKLKDYYQDTAAFIVVKCFVINDIIDYSDGKQYFNVVYSTVLDNFNNILLNKPIFDEYGNCVNMVKVNYLYDTYEEAKHSANGFNLYLLENENNTDLVMLDNKRKEIQEYMKLEESMLMASNNIKLTRKKIRRF